MIFKTIQKDAQNCHHKERGQILVEVLIALTVMVLSLAASYLVSVVSNELIVDKKLSDQAALYVEEGVGATRSIKSRGWGEIATGTHGLVFIGNDWDFSGTQDMIGSFTREVIVTDVATRTKKVETRVSWTGFPSISRQISAVTHLSNWTEENLLYTPWLSPGTLSSGDLIPSGNKGTDVAVEGAYVYLTAYHADATSSDFFVFDVSDPAAPTMVTSSDTGLGLDSISIKKGDTLAFVVSKNDANGFKVIDISSSTSPSVAAELNLPGTGTNNVVFALGNYAYVGTANDTGDEEFIIIDITSSTSPSVVGSLEIGDTVNDIYVYRSRAYLATNHDSKELMVVDISDPALPAELGSYNWTSTENGLSVFVESPSRVFFGRQRWNSGPEFHILNAATASSITSISTLEIGDDINDIINVEWLSFLGTSVNNGELNIVNISNLSSPTIHSTFNYPQEAVGVDYSGPYIYVSTRSNDALRVVKGE